MTHRMQPQQELFPLTSFTITQFALGLPLHFEPAVGSKELDDLVQSYIPGPATSQQKRAQVALEFFNTIEASHFAHPVSLRYNMTRVIAFPSSSDALCAELSPQSSSASILSQSSSSSSLSLSSKASGSLKRARTETSSSCSSPAKRLPGFSIMTRDGVDITENASRGPKTKEQRDHAALMRKLKACTACKRSKQRCDPSHHHPVASALQKPKSKNLPGSSAESSSSSSTRGSRGSASPQSSLGHSFSESPAPYFTFDRTTQIGQDYSPQPPTKSVFSLSNIILPEPWCTDSDLSTLLMQDIDPDLFQLADIELDTWNSLFTGLPSPGYTNQPSYQLSYQSEDEMSYHPEGQASGHSKDQLGYKPTGLPGHQSEEHLGYQSESTLDSEGILGYQSEGLMGHHSGGINSGSNSRDPDPDQTIYFMYDHIDDEAISLSIYPSKNRSGGQEAIRPHPSLVPPRWPNSSPEPLARTTARPLASLVSSPLPSLCPEPPVCPTARPLAQSTTFILAGNALGLKNCPVQDPIPPKLSEGIYLDQKPRSLPQRLFSSLKRIGQRSDLEHLSGMLMSLTLK